MSFDLDRFRSLSLSPRQAQVRVNDLAAFFPAGVEPVWTIRGLTGEEIARANAASQRQPAILAAVEALAAAGSAKADQIAAIQTLIGYGQDTPEDLAKRFDHLTFGSVDPVIDRESAVKLFAAYPIVAYTLTNRILELTGLGPDLGKAPASTDAAMSPSP
jgi:hypothetical protein